MVQKFIGQQLIADLYGCDRQVLNDLEGVRAFIHEMCEIIGTEIVEEAYHKFQPIGISAFAVITTSHFSIHTWPEFGYAAIDVFSCNGALTMDICRHMRDLLGAGRMTTKMIPRQVSDQPLVPLGAAVGEEENECDLFGSEVRFHEELMPVGVASHAQAATCLLAKNASSQ